MKALSLIIFFVIINSLVYSQPNPNMGTFEVLIENYSNNLNYDPIYARVSPVGAVFNGDRTNLPTNASGKYAFESAYQNSPPIYGGISQNLTSLDIQERRVWINHERGGFHGADSSRRHKMEMGFFNPRQSLRCFIRDSDVCVED